MGKQSNSSPFAVLGDKLKLLRQQQKETLAEAAGAVEIGEEDLQRIEEGFDRPSEEILMLLISHFGIKEDDAVQLWELAGYDGPDDVADSPIDNVVQKTITMAIAIDPRIMYSDQVQITGNQYGIVLTFMQPGSGQMPQMPVARVGLSRPQAKKVLQLLQDTLTQLDKLDKPKRLPPDTENN